MAIACGLIVVQDLDSNEPLSTLDFVLLLFGDLRPYHRPNCVIDPVEEAVLRQELDIADAIEDMVLEYDTSDFIGSAILSVDLRAIAHAMLFLSVDNLAQITKYKKLRQAVNFRLLSMTNVLWLVDNDPFVVVVIRNGASAVLFSSTAAGTEYQPNVDETLDTSMARSSSACLPNPVLRSFEEPAGMLIRREYPRHLALQWPPGEAGRLYPQFTRIGAPSTSYLIVWSALV
ncbi:hypothetical protein EDD85DRAFT_788815 [Armillaria nabsnona]|nr:hypothetical protein EDD85DRAFT_788815 [Armillaria nabsnona]